MRILLLRLLAAAAAIFLIFLARSKNLSLSQPTKVSTSPRLFLFTSVATHDNLELFGRFLRHYRDLGIPADRIHVDIHFTQETNLGPAGHEAALERLHLLLAHHGVLAWRVRMFSEFVRGMKVAWVEEATTRMGLTTGDWMLYVDHDEFQVYLQPLSELLSEAEKYGISAFQGSFVDRVYWDGRLVDVTEDTELSLDFPWGCRLVKSVYKGLTTKLGPYKFGLKQADDWHSLDLDLLENEVHVFRGIQIHHFRWGERALQVPTHWESQNWPYWQTKAYLESHNNKICVWCPEQECVLLANLPPMSTIAAAIEGQTQHIRTMQKTVPKKQYLNPIPDRSWKYYLTSPDAERPLENPDPEE